jgi:signal peptidase I
MGDQTCAKTIEYEYSEYLDPPKPLPVTLWITDLMYSTCKVRGTSMEPTLKDGDVVLVRKSDVLSDFNLTTTPDDATDRARLKRMEATMSNSIDHPIISRPPIVVAGHVVVFTSPKTAFPHEYRVKRVAAVGGQLVSPKMHI